MNFFSCIVFKKYFITLTLNHTGAVTLLRNATVYILVTGYVWTSWTPGTPGE